MLSHRAFSMQWEQRAQRQLRDVDFVRGGLQESLA
jgi:hypothetical protein